MTGIEYFLQLIRLGVRTRTAAAIAGIPADAVAARVLSDETFCRQYWEAQRYANPPMEANDLAAFVIKALTKASADEAAKATAEVPHELDLGTAPVKAKRKRSPSKIREHNRKAFAREHFPALAYLLKTGLSLSATAHEMNRRGIKSLLGGKWQGTTVKRIMDEIEADEAAKR